MSVEASSTISLGRICLAMILVVSHLLLVSLKAAPVSSFVQQLPSQTALTKSGRITNYSSTVWCGMGSKSTDGNTEITKQLERAKAALAISRAKMEAQEQAEAGLIEEEKEENTDDKAVPFFAMNADDENGKKDRVVKDKNEDGGFTTDGDLMAKLSEEEEWESRPLLEVFQNEKEESPKAMNIDRDIGQSMYNLRKSLQTEDFMKIFDKRNRFIGDA